VPTIIAPRTTVARGYPATPIVAPPDGARLSILARKALEHADRLPAPLSQSRTANLAMANAKPASSALTPVGRHAPHDDGDSSPRKRAIDAYTRTRDATRVILGAEDHVDILV
jgi:hypothetical protein